MVDEAGQVATFGGINDCVMVYTEEVAAPYALLGIPLLTHVSHHLQRRTRGQAQVRGQKSRLLKQKAAWGRARFWRARRGFYKCL